MRRSAFDDVMIKVVCRDCGTGECKPVVYFRNCSRMTCQGCGREIDLENKQMNGSIAEFGYAMARLREPYIQ